MFNDLSASNERQAGLFEALITLPVKDLLNVEGQAQEDKEAIDVVRKLIVACLAQTTTEQNNDPALTTASHTPAHGVNTIPDTIDPRMLVNDSTNLPSSSDDSHFDHTNLSEPHSENSEDSLHTENIEDPDVPLPLSQSRQAAQAAPSSIEDSNLPLATQSRPSVQSPRALNSVRTGQPAQLANVAARNTMPEASSSRMPSAITNLPIPLDDNHPNDTDFIEPAIDYDAARPAPAANRPSRPATPQSRATQPRAQAPAQAAPVAPTHVQTTTSTRPRTKPTQKARAPRPAGQQSVNPYPHVQNIGTPDENVASSSRFAHGTATATPYNLAPGTQSRTLKRKAEEDADPLRNAKFLKSQHSNYTVSGQQLAAYILSLRNPPVLPNGYILTIRNPAESLDDFQLIVLRPGFPPALPGGFAVAGAQDLMRLHRSLTNAMMKKRAAAQSQGPGNAGGLQQPMWMAAPPMPQHTGARAPAMAHGTASQFYPPHNLYQNGGVPPHSQQVARPPNYMGAVAPPNPNVDVYRSSSGAGYYNAGVPAHPHPAMRSTGPLMPITNMGAYGPAHLPSWGPNSGGPIPHQQAPQMPYNMGAPGPRMASQASWRTSGVPTHPQHPPPPPAPASSNIVFKPVDTPASMKLILDADDAKRSGSQTPATRSAPSTPSAQTGAQFTFTAPSNVGGAAPAQTPVPAAGPSRSTRRRVGAAAAATATSTASSSAGLETP